MNHETETVARRRAIAGTVTALAVGLVLSACGAGDATPERQARGGGDSATHRDPTEALSWRIEAPPEWDGRVVLVDDTAPANGARSAIRFDYVPFDSTLRPQSVLWVTVYDSLTWSRLAADSASREEEVIGRSPGAIYLARFPKTNGFPPGSRDSVEFERRRVTRSTVADAFRVVQ